MIILTTSTVKKQRVAEIHAKKANGSGSPSERSITPHRTEQEHRTELALYERVNFEQAQIDDARARTTEQAQFLLYSVESNNTASC